MVISVFNPVYFATFGVAFLIFLCVTFLCKKLDNELAARHIVANIMNVFLIFFVMYKAVLLTDPTYQQIRLANNLGESWFWNELPLHLCNINMIVIPVGICYNKRNLMAFSFFTAPIGALLALLMPSIGLTDASIFEPRVFGFYVTHFAVFFAGLSLYTCKIFRPTFKDVIPASLTMLGISLILFVINVIMRLTGINPEANYMFTYFAEGNPILEILYKIIHLPYLSVLPLILIFTLYFYGVTALCLLFNKKSEPNKD